MIPHSCYQRWNSHRATNLWELSLNPNYFISFYRPSENTFPIRSPTSKALCKTDPRGRGAAIKVFNLGNAAEYRLHAGTAETALSYLPAPPPNWKKRIVYSATRSGSKRFRVARFTARDEVECCKRNDESLILPRSSRGSYFPQYTNDNKMKLRPLLSTTSGFFHVFHTLIF